MQPYDGYFATREQFQSVRGDYMEKIGATLRAAQAISDRVVAFPTPIYLAGNDRVKYDAAALREQIDDSCAACQAVEGVVTVRLDERFLQDGGMYSNLTHLGLHGHREFGTWLAGEICRPSDRGDAVAGKWSSESVLR